MALEPVPVANAGGRFELLAPRERQVFFMFVRGFDIHAIAQHLLRGVANVTGARSRICRKLGIAYQSGSHDYSDFVRYARQNNIAVRVEPTDPVSLTARTLTPLERETWPAVPATAGSLRGSP
jgi:hypothetical protein